MWSSVPAACLSLGAACVCTVPFCWQFWVPHASTWTHGQVGGGSVPRLCPFPAPLLLPSSLGAHLILSKAVLGKVLAWSGAEQSFNSNPPSGGHRGDREEAPRAGKGLQGMTQAGQVQYSGPSLCTDPSVALGVEFESELSSRGGSAVRSRGCVMLPLALLVVHSKKAGHILRTGVCQGMSLAWHWASVGLLMRLLASKFTLQAAVKTSFPRGLGYHGSIKWVLQIFPFIRVSRGV